ncbi:MAG: signal peptidase I [Flavobacteriaceae bacterium]|nr:signal peptidase I [Flavobacteriaceae bacterium]
MTFTEWFYFFLAVQAVHFFGTWKLYKRSGHAAWKAAIPIYNAIILMKIINRPAWWVVLLFLPIINLIMFPVIWVETLRSFGRNSSIDTLLGIGTLGLYIYYINYATQPTYKENRSLKPRTAFGEWVGSVLFAVVIATIVHTYFIQPYIIPTGSLEKTLLTGDFLFVSKYHYGARVPQTVVSFPMVHDTIIGTGVRSYLKKPQLPYLRFPKLQEIKRNEIVVFSWPADTVRQFFVKEAGVEKPIDKKSNYVKRCVGLPGDTLEIIDGIIHINGSKTQLPDRAKPLYGYTAYKKTGISSRALIRDGISDIMRTFRINNINQERFNAIRPFILNVSSNQPENFTVITGGKGLPTDVILQYGISASELMETKKSLYLTLAEANALQKTVGFDSLVRQINNRKTYNTNFFPNDVRYNWNEDNFGPIVLPKTGATVKLNNSNIALYKKIIRDYENKSLIINNGQFIIGGQEATSYTFEKDYFWMMGDNRHRSEDSRFWGFVPDDHIVGKPIFIWMSIDGINDGIRNMKVRWDRVFTTVGGSGDPVSYRWHFVVFLVIWQGYSLYRNKRKK